MIRYAKSLIFYACIAGLLASCAANAQEQERHGNPTKDQKGGPRQPVPAYTVPETADVILGRPTGNSITLSILRYDRDGAAIIAYGTQKSRPSAQSATVSLKKTQVREVLLDQLKPDTHYFYRLLDTASGRPLAEGDFQTHRPSGSTFTFTVTADSHLDLNTDPALYRRTLANAKADEADFHVDLGDTFMTGKHESRENANQQYLAQRAYLAQLGQTSPLFLVVGNHDGEESKQRKGGDDTIAVWSNTLRKRYFPNPVPDAFFSGDTIADRQAGLLQDYYAWQWGDALFVVLNPYWYSSDRRNDDRWDLSLGKSQYDWLKSTLEASKARFKIVFIHQLVGGLDGQGRGGVEATPFGEWGGKNADGSDGFKTHRPGWEMPIHQLLLRNHVSMVFHGHDHLFAKQDLDGVVYQEVPQPGHRGQGKPRTVEEYGYLSGVILGGSGHLRITVSPNKLTADFVSALLPDDERGSSKNRQVAYSYSLSPGHE